MSNCCWRILCAIFHFHLHPASCALLSCLSLCSLSFAHHLPFSSCGAPFSMCHFCKTMGYHRDNPHEQCICGRISFFGMTTLFFIGKFDNSCIFGHLPGASLAMLQGIVWSCASRRKRLFKSRFQWKLHMSLRDKLRCQLRLGPGHITKDMGPEWWFCDRQRRHRIHMSGLGAKETLPCPST